MITVKRVTERLEVSLGPDSAPVKLTLAVETELKDHFGLDPLTAAERAETLSPKIGVLISERRASAEDQGNAYALTLVGALSDYIAGECHVFPSDSTSVIQAKRGRRHNGDLLKKLRSLSFSEFETFGKRVLHELGAQHAKVTPHGGDQGIDFFGNFSLGQLHDLPQPFLRLAHDVRLLFAGQAKHYPDVKIGPRYVRELIGSVSLARTKTFSKDGLDIFAELAIRPFSPVVAMLFTTGEITAGAYHLASSAGIVAKDGNQLSAFLADRGVGMIETERGQIFDEANFDAWLQTSPPNS